MNSSAEDQLHAIHSMMSRGHRSVRLEAHTLVLWGLAAALLILGVNTFFTQERFPIQWQRSLASNILIAGTLLLVGILDYWLTHRTRRQRDESLSFVQRQLIKVWWLLIGLIVLINIGMNFFGGGYLFYSIMLAIMGLAFCIHGLFSQQMLSWIGGCMLMLGFASVVLALPMSTIEWLSIMVFGLGFPALAWLLYWENWNASLPGRLYSTLAWLSVVLLPTLALHIFESPLPDPGIKPLSLSEYQATNDFAQKMPLTVVELPAHMEIPLRINIDSGVIEPLVIQSQLVLREDMLLLVDQQGPTGNYRLSRSEWKNGKQRFQLRKFDLQLQLNRMQGPQAFLRMQIEPY